MSVRNSHESYGAVAIALHWAVALLVLGAWLLGQLVDELSRGDPRDLGLLAHIALGLAIIGFVTVRVLWRLADPPPPPPLLELPPPQPPLSSSSPPHAASASANTPTKAATTAMNLNLLIVLLLPCCR